MPTHFLLKHNSRNLSTTFQPEEIKLLVGYQPLQSRLSALESLPNGLAVRIRWHSRFSTQGSDVLEHAIVKWFWFLVFSDEIENREPLTAKLVIDPKPPDPGVGNGPDPVLVWFRSPFPWKILGIRWTGLIETAKVLAKVAAGLHQQFWSLGYTLLGRGPDSWLAIKEDISNYPKRKPQRVGVRSPMVASLLSPPNPQMITMIFTSNLGNPLECSLTAWYPFWSWRSLGNR